MFSYTDSNKKIVYILSLFIFLFFGLIAVASFVQNEYTVALFIGFLDLLMVVFLLSLSYQYRIDLTGISKIWLFRNKGFHIPISKIRRVTYRKKLTGGWSRRASLLIEYGKKKEQILLIKSRQEHYELLRLLRGWGIPLLFEVMLHYRSRPASQYEIDHLLTY